VGHAQGKVSRNRRAYLSFSCEAEQISKRCLLIRKGYAKDSSSRCASIAVAGNPGEAEQAGVQQVWMVGVGAGSADILLLLIGNVILHWIFCQ
jgi:hypothetical protein